MARVPPGDALPGGFQDDRNGVVCFLFEKSCFMRFYVFFLAKFGGFMRFYMRFYSQIWWFYAVSTP